LVYRTLVLMGFLLCALVLVLMSRARESRRLRPGECIEYGHHEGASRDHSPRVVRIVRETTPGEYLVASGMAAAVEPRLEHLRAESLGSYWIRVECETGPRPVSR